MAKARSSGRGRKSAGLEVQEIADAQEGEPAGLETGLVFVTFVALLVALLLSQLELGSSFGGGLFGG